ncbi:hypothetical protein K445DRAFT_321557 [Daldinia sp. EC12]|nr:hypothetical protein F4774DRAFT_411977 [Daldinia eschscholtzii]OTB11844.1 hypothetical protein K445DRAFT_321557 [Daldinia sp. EC12]
MVRNVSTSFFFGLCLLAGTAVAAGTPTEASGSTGTQCENPNQTTGYPDYNSFCQCPPYTPDSPEFGNPYLGLVKCDTKCHPAVASQTKISPANDSLDSCMKACTGSFEKAKRQEGDWFCHGVNFIQGELCEFIGQLGTTEFVEGGSDCAYFKSLDS